MERPRSPERFVPPTRRTLRELRRVCKGLTDQSDSLLRKIGWISQTYPLENGGEVYVGRRLRREWGEPIITVTVSDPPLKEIHSETKYDWVKRRDVKKTTIMKPGEYDVDLSRLPEELGQDIDLSQEIDPEVARRIIWETGRQFQEQQEAARQEGELGLSQVSDQELRGVIDMLKTLSK